MKFYIAGVLIIFASFLNAQTLINVTMTDGVNRVIGTDEIKVVHPNPKGWIELLDANRLIKYKVTEDMNYFISNTCNEYILVTDSQYDRQIAIRKDYIRDIEDSSQGTQLLTRNTRVKYFLSDLYSMVVIQATTPVGCGGSGGGGGGGISTVTTSAPLSGNGTPQSPVTVSGGSDGQVLKNVNGNWVAATDEIEDADANKFNELQNISLNGATVSLSIEGGSFVLPDDSPTNEIQTLLKSGNIVALSNGGGSFTDDTEDADADPNNELQTLSYNNGQLTISNGNTVTVGGGSGSAQTLSLSGNALGISDGNAVNLIQYLDNTDEQSLGLIGNSLSISGGNSVSLAGINTDNQNLSLSGSLLTISGGNNVNLAGIDTDDQTLSYNNSTNELTISEGNTVSLGAGGGGGLTEVTTGDGAEGNGTSASPVQARLSGDAGNDMAFGSDGGLYYMGAGASMYIEQHGDAWIRSSSQNIGFTKNGGIGTITVPTGAFLYHASIEVGSADLVGGHFEVLIDTQGSFNQSGGPGNNGFYFPTVNIVNTSVQSFGGPNSSFPAVYDEMSAPQVQVTQVTGGNVKIRVFNANAFDNFSVILGY